MPSCNVNVSYGLSSTVDGLFCLNKFKCPSSTDSHCVSFLDTPYNVNLCYENNQFLFESSELCLIPDPQFVCVNLNELNSCISVISRAESSEDTTVETNSKSISDSQQTARDWVMASSAVLCIVVAIWVTVIVIHDSKLEKKKRRGKTKINYRSRKFCCSQTWFPCKSDRRKFTIG